ncbi:hypothetical protein [Streptomyces canus]|uniref:hypothetical protein n=1 Tax=Streptomyces canus TaxID=58343 RepID=UPI00037E8888|nr:hypothetical protein [Streptomyces canus]
MIDRVRIPADRSGVLYDATAFSDLLRQIRMSPEEWEAYGFPGAEGTPGPS